MEKVNLQIPRMSQRFYCARCRNVILRGTFAESEKSSRYWKI